MFVKIVGKAIAVLCVLMFASQFRANDLIEFSYGPRLEVFPIERNSAPVATRTWDGGGVTNNWSEAANWSGDELPTTAVFDATSTKNAIIDISLDISGIQIMSGYTGSITMASGVNVTFGDSTASAQSGGTFNAGSGTLIFGNPATGGGLNLSGGTFNAGSGPITFRYSFNQTGGTFNGGGGNVSGIFQLTGGTFVAPSGNLTPQGESANFNAATFSHNNGTVVFVGGNMNISTPSSIVFNNVTINKNEFGVANFVDANRTIRVVGTLSLIEGRVSGPSTSPIKAEGAINIAPTFGFPDSSAGGSATILIKDGSGARNINWPSTASLPHIRLDDLNATLTLSGAGTAVSGAIHVLNGAFEGGSTNLEIGHGASIGQGYMQSGGTFHIGTGNLTQVTGAFELSGGTFTMDSGNATLPCFLSVLISGGTFNASSGTTTLCSSGDINGNFTQSAGVFNGGSGTLDLNHSFTLSGGTFNASSGNTRFGFTVNHSSGTFNHNNGTVHFDSNHGGYSINVPGTGTFHNLTFNPAALIGLSGDTFVANGTLRIMNGVVDGGTLQAKSDLIVESTADGGSALVMFNGTGPQTFTNNGGPNTTGAWTVNKPSGILTAATDLILGTSQSLNITAGTLYLGNGSDLTAGALNIGAAGTLANDSAATITLGANAVNNGTLLLNGSGPTCPQTDTILLRSSVDGVRRNWSGSGAFQITDVDVKDMGGVTASTPPITVFSGTNSGNNGTNWTFNGACGAATHLAFVTQPSNTTAGQTITPSIQVAVQDAAGNTVTNATNPITLSILNNPGGGVLSGTVTRNAVMGIATFDNLSINRSANGYTLQATSPALISGTSVSFNISAGAPSRLAFVTQPSNTDANATITPPIQAAVQDALGNVVPTSTDEITIALESNPGGASLGGTTLRQAIAGVATFDDLSLNIVSTGYSLRVQSGSLTAATSVSFAITRPIFMVTSRSDSGAGSLRKAIIDANTLPGPDTIHFNLSMPGPFSIAPVTPLPEITDQVVIDGSTQPGYGGSPIVELTGNLVVSPGQLSNGLRVRAGGCTIKGLVIGRFTSAALYLGGSGGNTIQGNYIGTDTTGGIARGNRNGIDVFSSNNLIGGTTAGAANLISGNLRDGIQVAGYPNNRIHGNLIGVAANGVNPLANLRHGIYMPQGSALIGGLQPEQGNLIAFNGQSGVKLFETANNTSPLVRLNSIHSNAGLGIDVWNSGVTLNDTPDLIGPQNFPFVDLAITRSGSVDVRGHFVSAPLADFDLDFYSSPGCDSSGNGEGRTYLGSKHVQTGSYGHTGFFQTLSANVPVGHFIAATATDASGSTSEFSPCRLVAPSVIAISGRAVDTTGAPLAYSRMTISGGHSASVLTNSNGEYSFADLPTALNYTVTCVRANYQFTPPSRSYTSVLSNQTNQDFVGTRTRFSISGQVTATPKGGDPLPLSSVRLTLSGAAAQTQTSHGYFFFFNLPPGNYALTPTKEGYTFSPPSVNITISNADVTANFSGSETQGVEGRLIFADSFSIFSMNANGTADAVLRNTGATISGVSLSRDGLRIAYTKYGDQGGLFVMNADGYGVTQLLGPGGTGTQIDDPAWSPNGVRIAFVINTYGWNARSALIINSPATNTNAIVPLSGVYRMARPTWISETRLAFTATPDAGSLTREIYAVNTDGSGLAQLTNSPQRETALVASPDGTKIAFSRVAGFENPAYTLHTMNADGTNQTSPLRNDPASEAMAWSPDGTLLAYLATSRKLIAVNPGTGAQVRVIRDEVIGELSWGPEFRIFTPIGTNITANAGGAKVTYASVSPGAAPFTTFTPLSPEPFGPAPAGFVLSSRAYEISMTQPYTGPVTVCLNAPPTTAPTATAFNALAVFHREGGVLVDRTVSRDLATRNVCAQASTLSPFVLAEQAPAVSPVSGLPLPSIRGAAITSDGQPLSDVLIQLSGAETRTTRTDLLGNFEFVNLTEGGDYILEPQLIGHTFDEPSRVIPDLDGEVTLVFAGTAGSFSISGRVETVEGVPVPDTLVELEGSSSSSTITDANGDYTFADLPASGFYIIQPLASGIFGPPAITVDALIANTNGLDFIHYPNAPEFATVSGRVTSSDGLGISRVIVTITDSAGQTRSAITNAFGYYGFTGVGSGDFYTINVALKRYEFPDTPYVIFVTQDMNEVNFTSAP